MHTPAYTNNIVNKVNNHQIIYFLQHLNTSFRQNLNTSCMSLATAAAKQHKTIFAV
jgi:hypothetical protein